MTNRRSRTLAFTLAALAALLLPAAASAQDNRPSWEVMRDRAERDRDRRRDDDRYGRRGGRISDYDRRVLRDTARRIKDRSRDLERDVDRALDHSRYDDTRREDNINQQVRDFHRAADRFASRAGDSNDLGRSSAEARELLDMGARLDRILSRLRLDGRTDSDWSQIHNDLRTVSDFYGYRSRGYDDDVRWRRY